MADKRPVPQSSLNQGNSGDTVCTQTSRFTTLKTRNPLPEVDNPWQPPKQRLLDPISTFPHDYFVSFCRAAAVKLIVKFAELASNTTQALRLNSMATHHRFISLINRNPRKTLLVCRCEMWKLSVWAALLACGSAQVTCPDTTGSCAMVCDPTRPRCNAASLDCSTNSACTLNCSGNGYGCTNVEVKGLYQPNANDYALLCGEFGCGGSNFTTRGGTSRILCLDCFETSIDCRSDHCELTCAGFVGCPNTPFNCPGGPGKTCAVRCDNKACWGKPQVTCDVYPCNVTTYGNQTEFTPVCLPGQMLCANETCVNGSSCPGQQPTPSNNNNDAGQLAAGAATVAVIAFAALFF